MSINRDKHGVVRLGIHALSVFTLATTGYADSEVASISRRETSSAGGPSRLMTGPAETMRSAVAGANGMRFELRPMFSYDPGGVNGTYNTAGYYHAGNILENTLVLPGGGGRVYFDLFLSGWGAACQADPCNGYLRIWEIFVDAAGYSSGAGGALVPAVEPCANTTNCLDAFGTSPGPFCSSGFCRFAWINKNRADGVQRFAPPPPCSTNIWDLGNLVHPSGHNYFGVRDTYDVGSDTHCGEADDGNSKYGGSFALDVPPNATGTYTIGLVANTNIWDDTAPESLDISVGLLQPAVVILAPSSTENVGGNETVVINVGGGTGNLEEDALVSITNESGSSAPVTAIQTDAPVNPGSGNYVVFGSTLLVNTSIADGDHFMTILLPFDDSDIGYGFPLDTELLWFNSSTWTLAVSGNTANSPGHATREGDRFAQIGTVTPDISELSGDLGDYGVFWNTATGRGFVWANVDHTSAFSAAGPLPPTIPAMGNVAVVILGASLLGAGGWVVRRRSLADNAAA